MKLFFLMWLSYALIAYNMRVLAAGKYTATVISDGIIAVVGFTILKSVAQAETWSELVFYTLGAMAGGVTGIWISKIRIERRGTWRFGLRSDAPAQQGCS